VEVIGSNPIAPTINLLSIRELSRLRCPEMSSCLEFATDFHRKHYTHNAGMRSALLITDGLRIHGERGGKNAKKRAAVAVARKLAVLLHRLWVSGEVYEPRTTRCRYRSRRQPSRPGGRGERPKARGQSPRDLLWRAGPKLMKREPKLIQEVWQTTTSTALFG
jgi:hypothetical protein